MLASYLNLIPAWRSMLLSVPTGISFFGCGTVTRPLFDGCRNWMCEPDWSALYQPSFCNILMIIRLSICVFIHIKNGFVNYTCLLIFPTNLSPSIHKYKYDNVFIHSGLSAEGALLMILTLRIRNCNCESKHWGIKRWFLDMGFKSGYKKINKYVY